MIAIKPDEEIAIFSLYHLGLIPVDIAKFILEERMKRDVNEMAHAVIALLSANITNEVVK